MILKLEGTIRAMAAKLRAGFFQWSRPRLVSGALADLTRSRKDLVVENAFRCPPSATHLFDDA